MLERARLMVRDALADGSQPIEDPATGVALGSARPTAGPALWLLAWPVLEVREAEDAPLVFTVRRTWSLLSRYEVRDAEGRPVGSLAGRFVMERTGRQFATLGPDGAFRTRDGNILARVMYANRGTEISFSEVLAADPYGKMLLLAAVLRVVRS